MSRDDDPLQFDDDTMEALTPHEREARSEIIEWRSSDDGILSAMSDAVGSAVGSAVTRVTPSQVRNAVKTSLQGAVEMIQDGTRFTFRTESILDKARSAGIEADSVLDLRQAPLKRLDDLATSHRMPNKLMAATEGGICGAFGAGGAAADLPLLFGVAFRGVQQVGTCYGFEMNDPDVKPVVMSVFSVGAGASSTAKARLLFDVHVAAEAFAKRWTYQKVAERTATGGAAQMLKKMSKGLPRKIARKITKQKLAQSLPFVGAAFGAGFNYRFLSNTLRAAQMTFRSLYLTSKYGV